MLSLRHRRIIAVVACAILACALRWDRLVGEPSMDAEVDADLSIESDFEGDAHESHLELLQRDLLLVNLGSAPQASSEHDFRASAQSVGSMLGPTFHEIQNWCGEAGSALLSVITEGISRGSSRLAGAKHTDGGQGQADKNHKKAGTASSSQHLLQVDPTDWNPSLDSQPTLRHHRHRQLHPAAGVGFATGTMLLIGGDDVIWLLSFYMGPDKWVKTAWYFLFMEIVVLGSVIIKVIMDLIEVHHPDCPVRKILQIIASVMLTTLAAYLFYDWWNDEDDDSEGEDEGEGEDVHEASGAAAILEAAGKPNDHDADASAGLPSSIGSSTDERLPGGQSASFFHNQHHEKNSTWMLFVISMVGSSDNFAIFSYMLFDEIVTVWQLFFGVFFASAIISIVAHGALAIKPLLWYVERFPLWVVFAALSIWSYIQVASD